MSDDAERGETPEAAYRMLHERVTGAAPSPGDRAISAAHYDAARAAYLREHGLVANPGVAIWPPTSQTVMKRVGGGSWSAAMSALGLMVNAGKKRGSGAFTQDDYGAAIREFFTAAADDADTSVASTAFAAYVTWASAQSAAGHKRPSGAAVRQHFGGWQAAKEAVEHQG